MRAPAFTVSEGGFGVARVSGLEIPSALNLKRKFPEGVPLTIGRPEVYDDSTLFYDVFWNAGQLVFLGPSLQELHDPLMSARISISGQAAGAPKVRAQALSFLGYLEAAVPSNTISLLFDGAPPVELAVQRAAPELFRGRKVMMTMSKDNDLLWIEDWTRFHTVTQGVDAVLFYDNGSTRYRPDDVLAVVRAVPGIKAAVVVEWPYRYGASGPGYNGEFSQHAAIEHARRRFLPEAAGVLQIDIDELIVSEGDQTAFERLAASPVGAITISGPWVAANRLGAAGTVRHRDFCHVAKSWGEGSRKWAAVPRLLPDAVQMTVHGFGKGFRPSAPRDITLRHFWAINTSWNRDRSKQAPFDAGEHVVDEVLVRAMSRVDWASPP